MPDRGYSTYKNKTGRFLVCKTHSDLLGWMLVSKQPHSELVQEATLRTNIIVTTIVIVAIISIIFAYIFSMNLYNPLSKILTEIKNRYGIKTSENRNEYALINNALKNLFERGSELSLKYQMAFPYFSQYSLIDLLTDNDFDTRKYNRILDLMDINFIHVNYMVALMELENASLSVNLKDSLEEELNSFGHTITYVLSSLSYKRIIVLINTNIDTKDACSIFEKIKNRFNEKGIVITVSLGGMYNSPDCIPVSYNEALKQINNKFFIGKNKIIYQHE